METIIIGDKQHAKEAKRHSYKKKILFYNENHDILVYQGRDLSIPGVVTSNNDILIKKLHKSILLPFDANNIEELVQVCLCNFKYKTVNNKLVKEWLLHIKDYYTCLVSFNKGIEETLQPFTTSIGYTFAPKIMNIDEAIRYLKKIKTDNYHAANYALEAFKQKIKK